MSWQATALDSDRSSVLSVMQNDLYFRRSRFSDKVYATLLNLSGYLERYCSCLLTIVLRASGRAAENNNTVGFCLVSCMVDGIAFDIPKLNDAAESTMNYTTCMSLGAPS